MFDANVYMATLEPPKFKDRDGTTHVGEILGADHWMRLVTRYRLAKANDMDPTGLEKAMRAFVDAVFPPPARPAFSWRRPFTRRPRPTAVSDLVWQLPQEGRLRAIWDFTVTQAKAMGLSEASLLGKSQTSTPHQAVPVPA